MDCTYFRDFFLPRTEFLKQMSQNRREKQAAAAILQTAIWNAFEWKAKARHVKSTRKHEQVLESENGPGVRKCLVKGNHVVFLIFVKAVFSGTPALQA